MARPEGPLCSARFEAPGAGTQRVANAVLRRAISAANVEERDGPRETQRRAHSAKRLWSGAQSSRGSQRSLQTSPGALSSRTELTGQRAERS